MTFINKIFSLTCLIYFMLPTAGVALKLPLPPQQEDLAGQLDSTIVSNPNALQQIAQKYDVGFFELLDANPKLDPKQILPGTAIIIPRQYLLPHATRQGIVINLGTMRLFYFPKNKDYFYTYPIGIGKKDWNTPLGKLSIIEKIENPVWHVPNSIYNYRLQHGNPVTHTVPSGPENPLGYFALRLSHPTYLIHGTNEPESVGVRSSAGCIHLYPEDIKELFKMVHTGTPVLIINEPYLAGIHNNSLYVEAHLPLEEDRARLSDVVQDSKTLVHSVNKEIEDINTLDMLSILNYHTGIPTEINSEQ